MVHIYTTRLQRVETKYIHNFPYDQNFTAYGLRYLVSVISTAQISSDEKNFLSVWLLRGTSPRQYIQFLSLSAKRNSSIHTYILHWTSKSPPVMNTHISWPALFECVRSNEWTSRIRIYIRGFKFTEISFEMIRLHFYTVNVYAGKIYSSIVCKSKRS